MIVVERLLPGQIQATSFPPVVTTWDSRRIRERSTTNASPNQPGPNGGGGPLPSFISDQRGPHA